MNTYYKVFINRSSKNVGSKEGYTVFDKQEEFFKTVTEAKKWIDEKYGSFKKVKMYKDGNDNQPYQCGWIYCFKDYTWEDGKKFWFWEQDWTEIKEIKEKTVLY
jgi:hypothetical protein